MRYDKYKEITMHFKLWSSNKVSPEDKKWLDTISQKRNLKFSEQFRIERLYKEIFGDDERWPEVS